MGPTPPPAPYMPPGTMPPGTMPTMPAAAAPEMGLKDYMDVLRRRKGIAIQAFLLVLAVGFVVTLMSKPVYQTRAKLLVPAGSPQVTVMNAENPIITMLAAAQPDSVATQIEVLQTREALAEAFTDAQIKPEPAVIPPSVRIEVVSGNSNIIQITVEGGNPEAITRLANTILDKHVKRMDLNQTTGLQNTVDFVRKERDEAERQLAAAETALISFNKSHRVAKLTAEQQARTKEYVDLQARVREMQDNVESTQAQIARITAELAKQPLDIKQENVKDNPKRLKLQEKLTELEVELAQAKQEYQPGSRMVKSLEAQVASMKAAVEAEPLELAVVTHTPNPDRPPLQSKLAELRADLEGFVANHHRARARFQSIQNTVDDIGPWEIQHQRLTQAREAALASFTSMSDKLKDLEIRQQARITTVRPIERAAVPNQPIAPRKEANIALTFMLGLAAAIGLALLQEYLDDRVNSPEDLERVASLPTLGHVPLIGQGQSRLVATLPANSHVAESYRALRSSIGFAGIDTPLRRLQITSATKGEGKTITSVNLATAMAMDGKKVILVDADLRRPTIHRALKLDNPTGLTEVLLGLKTVDEAIQPTEIDNLSVVCSGPIPPNPAELLGSRAFDQLIEQLEERADVVIFDTPPCMPVTDPLIVASRMDGVVLVLHVGRTKKGMIKHVRELLNRARARVVGVVFNQVEASKGGYYYYHYYYYYGDGYYSEAARRGDRHRRNGRRELEGERPLGIASRTNGEDRDGEQNW
jgi:polysaccharide biosynthesis transport protein